MSISDRFKDVKEPTIANVELGDFLFTHVEGNLVLMPIHNKEENRCSAHIRGNNDYRGISGRYEELVVIKSDGSYLIGEELKDACIANCDRYKIVVPSFNKSQQLERKYDLSRGPLDFDEPNDKNVEIGDLLVSSGDWRSHLVLPIVNKEGDSVWATDGDYGNCYRYDEAIVLKQGRCLIGNGVKDRYSCMLEYEADILNIEEANKMYREDRARELSLRHLGFRKRMVIGLDRILGVRPSDPQH
ncbi:MAG TPA: hypothetical protein VJI75_00870 [Candidatus Nanoarchaeia archaeon]|nr:hypothetical protein [Candidatus Nanoarchaeia archaeon]